MGTLKSLASDNYVNLIQKENQRWILTKDGLDYVHNGTPEYKLYHLLTNEGVAMKDIDKNILKLGQNYGMKKKWIRIDKGLLFRNVESVQDGDRDTLTKIQQGE